MTTGLQQHRRNEAILDRCLQRVVIGGYYDLPFWLGPSTDRRCRRGEGDSHGPLGSQLMDRLANTRWGVYLKARMFRVTEDHLHRLKVRVPRCQPIPNSLVVATVVRWCISESEHVHHVKCSALCNKS